MGKTMIKYWMLFLTLIILTGIVPAVSASNVSLLVERDLTHAFYILRWGIALGLSMGGVLIVILSKYIKTRKQKHLWIAVWVGVLSLIICAVFLYRPHVVHPTQTGELVSSERYIAQLECAADVDKQTIFCNIRTADIKTSEIKQVFTNIPVDRVLSADTIPNLKIELGVMYEIGCVRIAQYTNQYLTETHLFVEKEQTTQCMSNLSKVVAWCPSILEIKSDRVQSNCHAVLIL